MTYEWPAKPPVVRLGELGEGWLVAGVEGPLPKIADTVRRSVDRLIHEGAGGRDSEENDDAHR